MAEEAKSEHKHETPKPESPKKKDNTLKIVLIVVGVLVGLFLIAWVAMVVFVGSFFNRAGKNIKVNSDGEKGSVTIKSNDGQGSITAGEGAQLPKDFPNDVPVYKPSTTVYASQTDSTHFSVATKTNSSVSEVVNYYKAEMVKQGWTMKHESSYGDGTILTFTKGNRTVSVSISNQPDETTEKTFVNLTVNTLD